MTGEDLGSYCRAVEAHLCRVNGGHLVRVVGVAFELVKRWHTEGVPLKVVLRGIERRVERAARSPIARRRPLRVEFCEADVADVFDEWRRAVGFALHTPASPDTLAGGDGEEGAAAPSASLPRHLERIAIKLTSFLVVCADAPALRARAEQVLADVDAMRQQARGARGAAREAVLARLAALDEALLEALPGEAPAAAIDTARQEARDDLAAYAGRMSAADHARAVETAARRIARDRLGLPRLSMR